ALEDGRAVVDDVGEDVDGRVFVGDELPVEPDLRLHSAGGDVSESGNRGTGRSGCGSRCGPLGPVPSGPPIYGLPGGRRRVRATPLYARRLHVAPWPSPPRRHGRRPHRGGRVGAAAGGVRRPRREPVRRRHGAAVTPRSDTSAGRSTCAAGCFAAYRAMVARILADALTVPETVPVILETPMRRR